MRRFMAAVAICSVLASGGVHAQGVSLKPGEVIAARRAGMALLGGLSDTMKAGVKAGTDPRVFADGAEAMVAWGHAYLALFPDGTQKGDGTKAKPEIWSDRAGFDKADAAYVDAVTKLTAAAKSGDKTAFADAFGATGKTCGGCHRNYKERD